MFRGGAANGPRRKISARPRGHVRAVGAVVEAVLRAALAVAHAVHARAEAVHGAPRQPVDRRLEEVAHVGVDRAEHRAVALRARRRLHRGLGRRRVALRAVVAVRVPEGCAGSPSDKIAAIRLRGMSAAAASLRPVGCPRRRDPSPRNIRGRARPRFSENSDGAAARARSLGVLREARARGGALETSAKTVRAAKQTKRT